MSELLKEIMFISIILTFIGTMFNIYYTRKNLKTTKYIDTITSERIKWIDIVRDEVTNIVTNINFTLKIYSEKIQDREDEIKNEDDIEALIESQLRYFYATTSSALGQRKEIWSQSDFIKYLYVFKLRLNLKENTEIIDVIDYFIKFYTKSEYKSPNEINVARERIISLIAKTQELLKKEWEKVKRESMGRIKSTS